MNCKQLLATENEHVTARRAFAFKELQAVAFAPLEAK